ncbi:MAG: helix-turn-helix domain-containing protein [Myxococcota bacterium]
MTLGDLTPELRGELPEEQPSTAAETVSSLERRRILRALEDSGGRKAEAAKRLSMSRSTLWRKLREHGMR